MPLSTSIDSVSSCLTSYVETDRLAPEDISLGLALWHAFTFVHATRRQLPTQLSVQIHGMASIITASTRTHLQDPYMYPTHVFLGIGFTSGPPVYWIQQHAGSSSGFAGILHVPVILTTSSKSIATCV